MKRITGEAVNSENIAKVELLCSKSIDENVNKQLKKRVNIQKGKSRIFTDSYLQLCFFINCYYPSLKLDGIKVITTDELAYSIFTDDIIDRQIAYNDKAIMLLLNVLNFINNQEKPLIKVFDDKRLDYIDYQDEELSKEQSK